MKFLSFIVILCSLTLISMVSQEKEYQNVDPLLSNYRTKDFETGAHVKCPLSFFNKAHKIRIAYNEYVLVQMDGEVHLLHPKQFPLTMERTEPVIKIIECDDAQYYKGAEKAI